MWIAPPSIRLSFALELGCSEKDLQPDFDTWVSIAAVSSTLNGKHTRAQSWKLACRKGLWLQRLYGAAISENSLPLSFVAQWIASLLASRAKTSAWRDGVRASMENAAACSLTSSTLPTLAVRGSCFWRTSQASLLPPPPLWTKPKGLLMSARPPESWENWPTAGGMRNGSLFQRPKWVPATGESGGSALRGGKWTTPDVCSGARDMSKIDPELQKRADTKRTTGLPTEVAMWLTPNVPNGGRSVSAELVASKCMTKDGQKRTIDLGAQVTHWATPQARDHKSANSEEHCTVTGGGRKHMDQLSNFVAHSSLPALKTRPGPTSCASTPPTPRRLNPIFGEWLMGWPSQWTKAEPSASSALATALWRSRLQQHLSCLLGELE